MQTREELIKEYKDTYPNWTDEAIEEYADMMVKKYSTLKQGLNVIHLDYYSGLINDEEIEEIENSLAKYGLELSRFDKIGVPYASIDEFNLHLLLFLNDSIVQSILLGIGANALWDAIKRIIFSIWKKVKERYWQRATELKRKTNLNFGLKVKVDKNTSLDLKLDGDLDEKTILEALDKVIDLIKATKQNDIPKKSDFYFFDKEKNSWIKVDIMKEIAKIYEAQQAKEQNGV